MEQATIIIETGKETIERIEEIKSKIRNSPTGVSFLSIREYQNKKGEISNYLINVGLDYGKEKAKDIKFLQELDLMQGNFKSDLVTLEAARTALISSLITPDANKSMAQQNAYDAVSENVKRHVTLDKIYVYGTQVKKQVLVKGVYKEVKHNALTIAKNELKAAGMVTTKWRQFIIDTCEVVYTTEGFDN